MVIRFGRRKSQNLPFEYTTDGWYTDLTMFFKRIKEYLIERRNSGIFRNIPLDVKGKLYASPMPFGAYDRGARLMKIYQQCHVNHVFMVITDEELDKKARRNLRKQYEKCGITYSQYSIKDFQAPSYALINDLVNDAIQRLATQNIAVHCHAGVGRTAIAICCILKTFLNCSAQEAIDYAKKHMEVNMTSEQIRVINEFERKMSTQSPANA